MHPSFGEVVCKARDISDGGMFIVNEDTEFPPVGTVMQAQALDMQAEAPLLKVRIMHKRLNGIGLAFCQ